MRNSAIFILLLTYCIILTACSPSSQPPENGSTESTAKKDSRVTVLYQDSLTQLAVSNETLKKNYVISTQYFSDRDSIPYLKKPRLDTDILLQDFYPQDKQDESDRITMMIIQFPDISSAKEETEINFSILENQAKRDSVNIQSFETNTIGDESIAITFQSERKYPVYLYARISNILIKINGGKNQNMEHLIEIANSVRNQLNRNFADQNK
ncbi:MAG: hypothetical protein RBU23_11380 [Candidatus Auribacterota bacterium]|nr:hypothetical protein [Candidatus Auribacterota bacterium]